jgi:CheY-like chemotaxis protein
VSRLTDILVIDDEQVVREGLCRVCEAGGLTIDAVGDAATGLQKLRTGGYRLVVCDVMLPELDGFQVLSAMKAEGITTPLVMITGCSTMQNAVNALKEGAIDFIPKPFTVDELDSGIRRGLKYQKLATEAAAAGVPAGKVPQLAEPCPAGSYRLGGLSWVRMESNGIGLVGVTQLFTKTISAVKELAFFDMDADLVQAAPCASLTSEDSLVHGILSPLSGKIVEKNDALLSRPELLDQDPYVAGWLYRIVPVNLAYELNNLIPCTQDI